MDHVHEITLSYTFFKTEDDNAVRTRCVVGQREKDDLKHSVPQHYRTQSIYCTSTFTEHAGGDPEDTGAEPRKRRGAHAQARGEAGDIVIVEEKAVCKHLKRINKNVTMNTRIPLSLHSSSFTFSISPAFPKNVDTHHTSSLLPFPLLLVAPGHDGAAHPVLLDRQVGLPEVRLAALALLLVVRRHKLAQLRLQLVVGAPRCGVGGVLGVCVLIVCPTMWVGVESQAFTLHGDAPIFSSSL